MPGPRPRVKHAPPLVPRARVWHPFGQADGMAPGPCPPTPWASTWAAVGVIVAGDDGLDLWALVPGDIVGIDRYGNGPPVWLVAWTGRAARCLEAPVPTVCHVLAVVEEQLSSGDLE